MWVPLAFRSVLTVSVTTVSLAMTCGFALVHAEEGPELAPPRGGPPSIESSRADAESSSPNEAGRPRTKRSLRDHRQGLHELERRIMRLEGERSREEGTDRPAVARAESELSRAIEGELLDLAAAFRSLDQSYTLRGLQSRKAGTASSAFMDWRAKGIDLPRSARVLPPPPRFLGCGQRCSGCDQCGVSPLFAEPLPISPCATCLSGPALLAPGAAQLDVSNLFTFRTEKPVVWKLLPGANARTDSDACLTAGAVTVAAIDSRIAEDAAAADAWTIRMELDVAAAPTGRTVLLSCGEIEHPQFAVTFNDNMLEVTLRTRVSGAVRETTVALMRVDSGMRRIAIRYKNGTLTGWIDGEAAATSNRIEGDLSCWTPQAVTIGHPQFDSATSARLRAIVLTAQDQ